MKSQEKAGSGRTGKRTVTSPVGKRKKSVKYVGKTTRAAMKEAARAIGTYGVAGTKTIQRNIRTSYGNAAKKALKAQAAQPFGWVQVTAARATNASAESPRLVRRKLAHQVIFLSEMMAGKVNPKKLHAKDDKALYKEFSALSEEAKAATLAVLKKRSYSYKL
ncbi:MAG: hypothetical protein KGO82_09570 [Bacteroidota bacterium]|nr:hypothetical protein [Bacteroidota bacterium]